ncbi:MAG: hypothetical protein RL148_2936 [Planctomycetota bacterium]
MPVAGRPRSCSRVAVWACAEAWHAPCSMCTMVRKVLSVVGGLAVLGLVAGSAGALMVVKDRISIVVQDEQPAGAPDADAMLRDELGVLQQKVGALEQSLASNFERLGTALDEADAKRHEELLENDTRDEQGRAALLAELRTQASRIGELSAAVGRMEQGVEARIAQLAANQQNAAQQPPVPPAAVPTEPKQVEPVAVEPVPEPKQPEAATPPTPEPMAQAAGEKPKRKGFLSFSIPDSRFRFDTAQTFTLVPDLCRVGFDAKSTLHDFTGTTQKVSGEFRADLDDPKGGWSGKVLCVASTLVTGVEGRDSNMWEHLGTEKHPNIEFTIDRFEPGRVDVAKEEVDGTIHGQMSIHGRSRDVKMPVTIRLDSSKRVQVEGQMPLKLTDYDIEVPSQLGGTIKMEDEVKVWIALRARGDGGAK